MKYIKLFEYFEPQKKYFIEEFAADYLEEHKFYLWEFIEDQGIKCHKILSIYHMKYIDLPHIYEYEVALTKNLVKKFEIVFETDNLKEAEDFLDTELQMRLQANKYNL